MWCKLKLRLSHFESSSALYQHPSLFSSPRRLVLRRSGQWWRHVEDEREEHERAGGEERANRDQSLPAGDLRAGPPQTAAGGQDDNTYLWGFSVSWGYVGLFRVSVYLPLAFRFSATVKQERAGFVMCFFMCHSLLSVP